MRPGTLYGRRHHLRSSLVRFDNVCSVEMIRSDAAGFPGSGADGTALESEETTDARSSQNGGRNSEAEQRESGGAMWIQQTVELPACSRGCHLITHHVLAAVPEIAQVEIGLLHVFIQHTSASLTINENADPDVMHDLQTALNRLVPERGPWRHTCEGPDDMPAHVKAALTDSSLTIPVRQGRLLLGTWQGICLCEHRNHGGPRRLVLTLQGQASGQTHLSEGTLIV